MILLREITAMVLWSISLMLILSCIFSSFNTLRLIIAAGCLAAAYFIWPSKKKGLRDDDFWLFDLAELLIEGPMLIVAGIIKLLD
jgi:hypothetical protein